MTKEQFLQLTDHGIDILREKDIEMGAMSKNWEPFNGLLSAEENKRCWKYLAEQFVMNTLYTAITEDKTPNYCVIESDEFYMGWLSFLPIVEGVVRYGQKNKGIESIVNRSGISRKNWIKFLD